MPSVHGVGACLAIVTVLLMTAVGTLHGAQDAAYASWLADLRREALVFGLQPDVFDREMRSVVLDPSLPDLVVPGRSPLSVKGQAEFTRPPKDYLNERYLEKLAAEGRQLLVKNRALLTRIEKEIGVEAEALLAIWGRETAFGRYKTQHDAISALATQAYWGRRKDLFRKELLYALKIIQDGHRSRAAYRASWAGATGLTQFMPSEFDTYAADFDGDGKRDIWGSPADALASAARQLKGKGWVTGRTWGYEVVLAPRIDCALEGPDRARPIEAWQKLGVSRAGKRSFPSEVRADSAYLMMPAGAHGPAFLVLENYLVIKRYNMSDLYALFVGHLADRIAGGGDFAVDWKPIGQAATRDITRLQEGLKVLGYPVSKIDGKIGSNTRHLIGTYQRKEGLPVDCWPSRALADRISVGDKRPKSAGNR